MPFFHTLNHIRLISIYVYTIAVEGRKLVYLICQSAYLRIKDLVVLFPYWMNVNTHQKKNNYYQKYCQQRYQ